MSTLGYFTSIEKDAIARYIDGNIPGPLRNLSSEYYDSVEKRLKAIFDEKLKQIQETALKPFIYSRRIYFTNLDNECVELIKEIFLKKFQCAGIEFKLQSGNKGSHAVFDLVTKDQVDFSMKVAWTPQNPYVYKSYEAMNKLEFEQSPEKIIDSLWKNAQNGIGTDLSFACEDKTFHVHSSVLRTNFNHFAVMFDNAFYKANKASVINVFETSANAFEQFLRYNYIGTLKDLVDNDNIDLLLDVFSIAHTYNDSLLMNHAIELLNISFGKFKDNYETNIIKLLNFSFLYDNLKLMEIVVIMLEQSNSLALIKLLLNPDILECLTKNAQYLREKIERL